MTRPPVRRPSPSGHLIAHQPQADAPLVVDPDAVLTYSATLEGLEPVSGRDTEAFERLRGPHLTQFAQRDPMNTRIDRPHALTTPQPFSLLVVERSGHETNT